MKLGVHEALCREGLGAGGERLADWEAEVGCAGHTLVPLRWVIRGNLRQDNLCGQTVPAKHVDCAAFTAAAARLSGLWDIVAARDDELAAGWDRRRAKQLLLAFGAITHTVQDMPAHSTWVEVHLQAGLPVPRWDWRGAAVPVGPAPVVSGTWFMAPSCGGGDWPDGSRRRDRLGHGKLNKDSPTTQRGSQLAPDGQTLHAHARELALWHTATEVGHLAVAAPNLVGAIRGGAGPQCARETVDVGRVIHGIRRAMEAGDAVAAAGLLVHLDGAAAGLASAVVGSVDDPTGVLGLLV